MALGGGQDRGDGALFSLPVIVYLPCFSICIICLTCSCFHYLPVFTYNFVSFLLRIDVARDRYPAISAILPVEILLIPNPRRTPFLPLG
jgi:hypothetical protein